MIDEKNRIENNYTKHAFSLNLNNIRVKLHSLYFFKENFKIIFDEKV